MENSDQAEKRDLTVEEQLAPLYGKYDLTNGQLQWLMERLSSDDQKMLKNQMKTCARDQFLTRGLPISAAITASVYFARKRLPDKLHFGPKSPWVFTSIIGVASFLFANMLTFGTCFDKSRSTLVELYEKYDSQQTKSAYDQLRTKNRQSLYNAFQDMHKAAYSDEFK